MSDQEKVVEYELQIEDMLRAIIGNLDELSQKENLSDFEKGRQLAYTEIMDIIKTRHSMILEVIED